MRGDRRSLAERLKGKFQQKDPDECWPWTAASDNYGRGRITVAGVVRVAAQVVLEAQGQPRPEAPNNCALHRPTCPPSCSNPNHLRWGSQHENMQDKVAIGTSRHKAGTIFNKSNLTEADIRDIRKSSLTLREQAELYEISERSVWDIKQRRSWVWVPDDPASNQN